MQWEGYSLFPLLLFADYSCERMEWHHYYSFCTIQPVWVWFTISWCLRPQNSIIRSTGCKASQAGLLKVHTQAVTWIFHLSTQRKNDEFNIPPQAEIYKISLKIGFSVLTCGLMCWFIDVIYTHCFPIHIKYKYIKLCKFPPISFRAVPRNLSV